MEKKQGGKVVPWSSVTSALRKDKTYGGLAVAGGYGIAISPPLDDGSIILTHVVKGSDAAKAGLVAGQKVISLNGVPIKKAAAALGIKGWLSMLQSNPAVENGGQIMKTAVESRNP